jgi:AcrR family transcriptional regulator
MARPRNADGQRTRQALLDAALDLFARKGYFGTSLRDVAGVVGVRESAIYNYFAGKDALFDALILADQDAKIERWAAISEAPITSGRAVLERLALASLKDFATPRQRKLFRILMSDGNRLATAGRVNLYERLSHGRDRMHAVMRDLIRGGWLRRTDPEVLAVAFVGPLMLWRHLHAIDADLPMIRNPRAFVRAHVDQFMRGASAARPAAPRARVTPRAKRLPTHRTESRRSPV